MRRDYSKIFIILAAEVEMATTQLKSKVDSISYQLLHNAISEAIPSFSSDITNTVILYLSYHQFYLGTKCRLSIKSGLVIFDLFDIHGRICYELQSQIINFNKIENTNNLQQTAENDDEKSDALIQCTFIGDYNACKLQHKSIFLLQFNTVILLMSWNIDKSHLHIPSIHYIRAVINDNISSPSKQQNMFVTQSSIMIFIPTNYAHCDRFIEIRDHHTDNPTIHEYLYNQHGNIGTIASGSSRQKGFDPIFVTKSQIIQLLGDNALFRDNLNNMIDYCDYFIFDLCRFQFDYITHSYCFINIAGINEQLHTVDSLEKIWFKTKKFWSTPEYEVNCIKIAKNSLFIIYRDTQHNKLCAGYFSITQNQVHPNNGFNVLCVMECIQKIELCDNFGDWRSIRSKSKIVSDPYDYDGTCIVFHMYENRSILHEYVIDKDLVMIDHWKRDLFGRDYVEYWHGKFCVDVCVEIMGNDYILGPENDKRLRSSLKSKDRKKIATEWGLFIAFIGGVSVAGSVMAGTYKCLFG